MAFPHAEHDLELMKSEIRMMNKGSQRTLTLPQDLQQQENWKKREVASNLTKTLSEK